MTKISSWRLWYLLFCLCYTAWIIYVGRYDFEKIHQDYSRAYYQLGDDRIEKDAVLELTRKCRKNKAKEKDDIDSCLSFPHEMVQKKIQDLVTVRSKNMTQASKKQTMFYISFFIFFILFPLGWLYLILLIISKLVTSVKVVK